MCISLGNIPGWLISPVALLRSQVGDVGPLKYMDPTAWAAVDQDEKKEKKEQKAAKANQEAWQKYYAARDAQNSPYSVLGNSKAFTLADTADAANATGAAKNGAKPSGGL